METLTIRKPASRSKKKILLLDGNSLTTADVLRAVRKNLKVDLSEDVEYQVTESRQLLNKLIDDDRIIYGVNTSMGGFVNWLIPEKHAQEMQENLIAAVATNVGSYLEDHIVKASMLVRINSLARGASAISLTNLKKLVDIYNKGIIPCVPSKGSLGASGDLGPLACIALVATGKWKAKYQGKILPGDEVLKRACIEPMKLSYKEGLSLINGTSTMAGFAATLVEESISLLKSYDIVSAMTFEALQVKKKPFHPIVHKQKKHRGQLATAENFWKLLEDSQMIIDEEEIEKNLKTTRKSFPESTNTPIEDSYSIRCSPQILGPIKDNLKTIRSTINNELNSSSDNPLVLSEEEDVFHNGHFHGQYISMAMDQLSISLTTLSNLSDRRIDRFMDQNHSNQLPGYLCKEKPGLRLGLMGGQFMATSVTAENRSLCSPLSIQTLTSTGDFQDIVSMGLVAARRAKDILGNSIYVIAFELLCASQAAEIRGAKLLSSASKAAFECVREVVPYLSSDHSLTDYLEDLAKLIRSGEFLSKVETKVGKLPL